MGGLFSLRYWILLCSGVLVVPLVGSEITWFCESGSVSFPRGSAGREVAVAAGGEGDVVARVGIDRFFALEKCSVVKERTSCHETNYYGKIHVDRARRAGPGR